MKAPDEAEILELWERGTARHPIDRALLLCAWARPDFPVSRLPDLPLGFINRTLLRLRETCFGPHIIAWVDCEHCGVHMEVALDTGQLLAASKDDAPSGEFEISGFHFRVPCSRDLAAIAGQRDVAAASLQLLQQCCLAPPGEDTPDFFSMMNEAESSMEKLDPGADINLSLSCVDCGHSWLAGFDIGSLLWSEIDLRARTLLSQVHSLAGAYGWTETEILALTPQRRTAYLDMVGV